MRVLGHCRAPAVEHGGGADASAEMLGIGGDRQQRLGGRAEQQVVDDRLVLVGDRSDRARARYFSGDISSRSLPVSKKNKNSKNIANTAKAKNWLVS